MLSKDKLDFYYIDGKMSRSKKSRLKRALKKKVRNLMKEY